MRRDREFIRIKETSLTQSKLAITERAIERFRSGDRFAGITMGKEYESLYRGKVVEWHRSWLSHHPNPQDNKFAIAMHGSSVRGEMVFNSDLDLAVCVENEGPGEEVKTSLGKFFQEAGVLADIHIWHPGVARRDGNPTFSQEINTGRYVCGDQDTFQQIASNAYFDRAAKAGHTIFETLKPPPYAKTTEAGVFNMKYDPIGSCSNLLVLRTLGNVYGGDGGSTLDQLQLLAQNGIFNDAEVEALHLAYSEYLFFRNLMHIFGDGLAERMGPRTRNYITKRVPEVGTPTDLQERLEEHRQTINTGMKKAVRKFLGDQGFDPNLYEQLSSSSTEKRLSLISSDNPAMTSYVAWASHEPEVLAACLETSPTFSTLLAVANSKTAHPDTYKALESITRNDPQARYIRKMLIVNSATPLETLPDLLRYSSDPIVPNKARRRMSREIYDRSDIKPDVEKACEISCFYPIDMLPRLLEEPETLGEITPNKLYINFAGRLAYEKNVIPYLQTLYSLHKAGVDFEAHVYGTISPEVATNIQHYWEAIGEDETFIGKIKYHGRYNNEDLREDIQTMQMRGNPFFLFSKGLVTQELIMQGVPVATTYEHNEYIPDDLIPMIHEADLDPVQGMAGGVPVSTQQADVASAKDYLLANYNFEDWGDNFADLANKVNTSSRDIVILGSSELRAPHGPATWARNLINAYSARNFSPQYFYDPAVKSRLARLSHEPLANVPETESDRVTADFGTFLTPIFALMRGEPLNRDQIQSGMAALINLSYHQDIIARLGTKQAQNIFEATAQRYGFDPADFHYPTLMFDEVSFIGSLNDRFLKLGRWLNMLQAPSQTSDGTYISYGDLGALFAIKETMTRGTPFIHVDHVTADDIRITRYADSKDQYTESEKKYFDALMRFLRQVMVTNVDAYVALWERNIDIARDQGIAQDKIFYIPNAIQEREPAVIREYANVGNS